MTTALFQIGQQVIVDGYIVLVGVVRDVNLEGNEPAYRVETSMDVGPEDWRWYSEDQLRRGI